jgi:hypothetical protein
MAPTTAPLPSAEVLSQFLSALVDHLAHPVTPYSAAKLYNRIYRWEPLPLSENAETNKPDATMMRRAILSVAFKYDPHFYSGIEAIVTDNLK